MVVARVPKEEEDAAPSNAGAQPPSWSWRSPGAPRSLIFVVERRGAARAKRVVPTGVSGVGGGLAGEEEPPGSGELEGRGLNGRANVTYCCVVLNEPLRAKR